MSKKKSTDTTKATGVSVSQTIATDIDRKLSGQESIYVNSTENILGSYSKTYGVPNKVWSEESWKLVNLNPVLSSNQADLKLDASQVKLLKTVVEFLYEASESMSSRKFLANSAKDLASQITDKFCIG
jgi:hypothetical protein